MLNENIYEDQAASTSNNTDKPNVQAYVNSCARTAARKKKIEKSMTDLVDIIKSNYRIRSQLMRAPELPAVLDDNIDLFF